MMDKKYEPMTRVYLAVFGALAALTALTVGVSYLDFSHANAIAIAVVIATVKVSLIALFFMHLRFEKKIIHGFFFTALFLVLFLLALVFPDIGLR